MTAKMIINKLGTLILIAMILGIAVGLALGETAQIFAPIGDLFMQLIKMVVVPMVLFSLIGGAASLGNSSSAGKIGLLTFIYYTITTIIATVIGLIFSVVFKPGEGISLASLGVQASNEYADKGGIPGFWETLIGFVPANPFEALVSGNILQIIVFSLFIGFAIANLTDKGGIPGFWETLIGFVPANPFEALVSGNILQIIVFSLFIGFAIANLSGEKKEFLLKFFNYMSEVTVIIMSDIMCIAHLGVFGLMAGSIGKFGSEILIKLAYLVVLYIIVLLIVNYGVIGGSVAMFSKCTTFKQFFKSMYKVQLFAFTTASSMATLPLNMKTTIEELHVSKETTSFALPLGATINMNGNAAYYAMAAIFFAQMFGIELTITQYIAIIFTSTVGAVGQAGVPGMNGNAAYYAMAAIFFAQMFGIELTITQYIAIIFTSTVGAVGQAGVPGPTLLVVAVLMSANIPIEALPILFGVDRIFDMLRTAVNITGDAACATIVDRFRE